MPNRVIRESILDSDRYWSVSQDARQFFFHLMLLADDLGVVSLAPVMLRRRCFDSPPTEKRLDKLVHELVDVDLLRRFEVRGIPYGLIPRFRQRLQITKPKFELPPEELLSDDIWLKNKVNEFRHKQSNPTVGQHPVQHPVHLPETKRILETKRNESAKPVDKSGQGQHPLSKNPRTQTEIEEEKQRVRAALEAKGINIP